MKSKIIRTILPTILGILSVIAVLIIFNLIVHSGSAFSAPDNGFFKFFVPFATVVALIIQGTITLPLWENFKKNKRIWGLKLVQFTSLLCVASGLAFGFLFWERNLGINELILISLTGIVAFSIYWSVNLITLKQLNKRFN
jgi:hypothetical protein